MKRIKEKEPAKLNYFFKGGYVELLNTIKTSFGKLGNNISDAWFEVTNNFSFFWKTFWPAIGGIFSLEFNWDDFGYAIASICKFSFALGKLLCVLVITTTLTLIFSLLHIAILFPIMLLAYAAYFVLLALDGLYCAAKSISSNCPNPDCQSHFMLPEYVCPSCKKRHKSLRPGRYGIWKRTCECGNKLPTTFFNGRQKLEAYCPHCNTAVKDGGKHRDICIPVVGGPSSGKTCFINTAISEIEKLAPDNRLDFRYSPNTNDEYEVNVRRIRSGELPVKTYDTRLKYYQFYLTPEKKKLKTLVSLCDVAGELFSSDAKIGTQIGYRYANAFILIIDPLSITDYRNKLSRITRVVDYNYSSAEIDETLDVLVNTLENMYCITAKDMLKTDVAVVFAKCDIPDLVNKIGEEAVREYIEFHPGTSETDAQNAVCEAFLSEYGESNFLKSLRSKFKTVRFFLSSSLGHNKNGTPFVSSGVHLPVLWLLNRITGSGEYGKAMKG